MIKRNDIQENIFIMEEYLKIITGEIDELNKIVPIGARLRAVRRGAGILTSIIRGPDVK